MILAFIAGVCVFPAFILFVCLLDLIAERLRVSSDRLFLGFAYPGSIVLVGVFMYWWMS